MNQFFLLLLFMLVTISFVWLFGPRMLIQNRFPFHDISFEDKSIIMEKDIQDRMTSGNKDPNEPIRGARNIIFLETSCILETADDILRTTELKIRQACALESAAKSNPQANVHLLHTCHMDKHELTSKYNNIGFWKLDLPSYFADTPLEELYQMGSMKISQWPKEHSSDVLRFLTLWKYGGTYLDMDIIVMRDLSELGSNFAGIENDETVGSSVLNFDMDSTGRQIARACLLELRDNFRGDIWGHNGPGLITRILEKFCRVKSAEAMLNSDCGGFKVHPSEDFFEIPYQSWKRFFEEDTSNQTMSAIQYSYLVHLWNKLSYEEPVRVDSQQPYSILAKRYCPHVYNTVQTVF